MISFNRRIKQHVRDKKSHLCVGLDISPELLGNSISLSQCVDHSKKVIDATQNFAVAYKPNLAFFERWGSAGYKWLEEILDYIHEDVLTIADGKRGDIGNTAQQYAESIFNHFGFDAVTVNPYMGKDAIIPFIENSEKGAFILCKTSNKSSSDFQNNLNGVEHIFERVAKQSLELNTNNNVGLIVGATHPEELKRIRTLAPQIPFLIPGIGAQGGDLQKSMEYGNGSGIALISVSRAIIAVGNKSTKAIRAAAKEYRDKMIHLFYD
jgi:orotidine-5'-phosphate decarboxylase